MTDTARARRGQAAVLDLLVALVMLAALLALLYAGAPPPPQRACTLRLGDSVADGSLAECLATAGCDPSALLGGEAGVPVRVEVYRGGRLVGAWGPAGLAGAASHGLVALPNGTLVLVAVRC